MEIQASLIPVVSLIAIVISIWWLYSSTKIKSGISSVDENDSLVRSINFYLNLREPEYAIMVNGSWGTGKTYQVKNSLKNVKCIYISLSDKNSEQDIHSAIFAKSSPVVYNSLNVIYKSKQLSSLMDILEKSSISSDTIDSFYDKLKTPKSVIIVDDFDKSKLRYEELFETIREYVTERKCHVILIANEKNISLNEDYVKSKEKIVGQTFCIKPHVSEAFDYFYNKYLTSSKFVFIKKESIKEKILDIYKNSSIESLRYIKFALLNIAKLLEDLENKKVDNEVVKEFIIFYCTIYLFLKGNIIDINMLKNSKEFRINRILNKNLYDFIDFIEKYLDYNINNLEAESILIRIFGSNDINVNDIENILVSASPVIHATRNKAWSYILSNRYIEEEQKLQSYTEQLQNDFRDRKVVASGEMLHVFAIRFLLVDAGIENDTFDNVRDECMSYIEDIYSSDHIFKIKYPWRDFNEDSFGGYDYWIQENYRSHFDELKCHLENIRKTTFYKNIESQISIITDALKESCLSFCKLIDPTHNENAPYSNIPILEHLDPNSFVNLWLSRPRNQWLEVTKSISNRINSDNYNEQYQMDEYYNEKIWINKVYHILIDIQKENKNFKSILLKKIIEEFVPDNVRGTKIKDLSQQYVA